MGDAKIILLADDDVEDQELLEDAILELEPVSKVHSVLDGKQVLEFLANCKDKDLPCLIILDYNMPGLNGPQVLQLLGATPRYRKIPKLVWSTSNTGNYIKECMENGATEYFVKPSSIGGLRKVAQNMLELC